MRFIKEYIKKRYDKYLLDLLIEQTGVRLDPEPNIWGILDPNEEEVVLARLYADKLWLALLRKYAEGANKAMINRANMDQEYWKFRGQFFCYNSMILKSKRAFIKLQKNESNRTQI